MHIEMREDRIAALREEIRRAGVRIHRTRKVVGGAVTALMVLAPIVSLVTAMAEPGGDKRELGYFILMGISCTALCCLVTVGFSGVAGYRASWRRRLRRHVAPLDPARCMVALTPLVQGSCEESRRLAVSLLRSRGLFAELAPAAAPDARGDEASPAEHGE